MKNVESCGLVRRGLFSALTQYLLVSVISILLKNTTAAPEIFTNSFLVKLTGNHGHEQANLIAKRHGFENVGKVIKLESKSLFKNTSIIQNKIPYFYDLYFCPKVLGAEDEFHFKHHGLTPFRSKRSVPHMRQLKADPMVRKEIEPLNHCQNRSVSHGKQFQKPIIRTEIA